MMQLVHIALVQWHLFSREDLAIAGDTAILGQNRSGKSTLIDLIQTVMTGGTRRWYQFNRSAGETGSRKSERTLRGYCLGQLNEHEFLREEAVTNIALVFADPQGVRPPVSVGLCIEASATEEAQVVGRYIAPGIRVDTDLLVEQLEGNKQRSASWALVRDRLEQSCNAKGTALIRPDGPRNHIREYMRQLFTGRRHSDPERFVRAFVMALSFEDMRSVEDFAHKFLLAKNDINIGELRESIQRYRDIQKDIHELERRLAALRVLAELVARFISLLEREEIARGVARLAGLIEAGSALLANLKERRDNRASVGQTQHMIERCEDEIKSLIEQQDSLVAQSLAEGVAGKRAVVQSELRAVELAQEAVAQRLQARFVAVARAASLLDHRDRLASLKLGALFQSLEALKRKSEGQVPPAWPREPHEMEELIASARETASANIAKILDRRDNAITQRRKLQEEIADLVERRDRARNGQVALDERTVRLMATLERENMRPRALCQVAEITDPDWREAAEALLGRDREAVLVEPEHASRAVEILRSGRDSFRGCRVVNTRRLNEQPPGFEANSLATIFASEDQLAMAFIRFRTGQVRLADTQAELLGGGRAIMRDGAYNSGIVVEVLRTQDLKIGRAAAPLMETELARQIAERQGWAATHLEAERFHDDIRRKLEPLLEEVPVADRLDLLAEAIDQHNVTRIELQMRLDRIAATVDPAIQQGLDRVKLQLRSVNDEKEELVGRRGQLKQADLDVQRRLGAGDGQPGSWNCLKARRLAFKDRVRTRAQLVALRETYTAQRSRPLSRVAQEMSKRADDARDAYRACEGEIREALGHYRASFDSTAPVATQGSITSEIKPWVSSNLQALEENELIQYRRQADEAAAQIGQLFRTAFIHELNARFNDLRTELDNLTRALKARPLHGEIYTLHARPKEEFASLHRLARESENDDQVFEALFGRGTPRNEEHAQALAEVERLLSEEALDFTAYQDYRNYFTFDLRMEDVAKGRQTSFDKRKGTASGAERQVPYYVVIGAALASIYHGARRQYETSELGLGLAVFDEAFSKMDGPNQRTLLEFYDDIGLQVVIAAPSEKRSVVYENLDSVIDVFRHGDSASAETVRIKAHARAQMRAANPQHLSDAVLAARLNSPASDAAE
ncbi:SbcC/MukB-like Walker B domain-containing protein [Mesorhizobium captivum]|uniref:SbcC/MukB-like Walker B domain-containing protein n=1 Tax=Mesorhizobium captivum TaxID=3072319 RepID=UPI002A24521D|nr:SbcC/MukB-like Walker B domain-containing protein [Mesorhizobium sp. VK22E]MDX8506247.1 SbcC/MukB-like Walker B domain-containing protein [Mesorhizobium sp. VK22E]